MDNVGTKDTFGSRHTSPHTSLSKLLPTTPLFQLSHWASSIHIQTTGIILVTIKQTNKKQNTIKKS